MIVTFIGGPRDGGQQVAGKPKKGHQVIIMCKTDVNRSPEKMSGYYVSGPYDGVAEIIDIQWCATKRV